MTIIDESYCNATVWMSIAIFEILDIDTFQERYQENISKRPL